MFSPFQRRQHRDGRCDGAIAVDQRRSEQADGDNGRSVALFYAQQSHQRQNAALAIVIDAHGEKDIFDGSDDEQRPEYE
jgi:hypothetical protein